MKRFFLILLGLSLFISCSKNKAENEVCFDGVVRWGGEPAADGLGWVIYKADNISGRPIIPSNLPDDFKVNDLNIHVCLYETDEKFYCQCVAPYNKYHITSIRRR